MITLYGTLMSRAPRVHWMLNELGLDYKIVNVDQNKGETQKPEFLAINPMGKVPAIDDNGTKLFESIGINLYLAMKYGKGLWPKEIEDQGRILQWSFWVMTEVEPQLIAILVEKFFPPEGKSNEDKIKAAWAALDRPLKVLNAHLKARQYLVGDGFSVADVNVASVLDLANLMDLDYKPWPNVQAWLDRCLARPARKKISPDDYKAAA